jgi:hypothetical protein
MLLEADALLMAWVHISHLFQVQSDSPGCPETEVSWMSAHHEKCIAPYLQLPLRLEAVLQLGAYFGYLKVDWARVHKDVIRSFDVNQDGCISVPSPLSPLPHHPVQNLLPTDYHLTLRGRAHSCQAKGRRLNILLLLAAL